MIKIRYKGKYVKPKYFKRISKCTGNETLYKSCSVLHKISVNDIDDDNGFTDRSACFKNVYNYNYI